MTDAAGLSNARLSKRACRVWLHSLRSVEVQGQRSIAQALAFADAPAVCNLDAMRFRADDPAWEGRERLNLSIGQCATSLQAVTNKAGLLTEDESES